VPEIETSGTTRHGACCVVNELLQPRFMDDILSIKLVPEWDSPSVQARLASSIARADLLQASIAYWTIDPALFGHSLTKKISPPNGFLCVDLHRPTDIGALAALVRDGAHVLIYCEDIPTYGADGGKEPAFLLHTKMLLFWAKDKSAELWVGSHNWTNRAIFGLNVESSLVVELTDSSRLFCEAAEYLQKIKGICEVFDLSRVDFYKELQKNTDERTVPVIEVEAIAASALSGLAISIFGTDDKDLEELRTVGKKVFLSATEPDRNETKYIYPAKITQVGKLNSGNPSEEEISFPPRRHAFRAGRTFAELLPKGVITPAVLRSAMYFVTLQLSQPDTSVTLEYPRAKTASWEMRDEEQSPLIRRLGIRELALLFRGKEPRVKQPVEIEPESRALTLYERRNAKELKFFSKRVIVRKK
jgi:hypothetical protein